MLTNQARLIKERVNNKLIIANQPLSLIAEEIELLTKEDEQLALHKAKCQVIREDADRSSSGQEKAIVAEVEGHMRRLASHESKIAGLKNQIDRLQGDVVNSLARAKGFAVTRDATATIAYMLRQIEVRQLLTRKQEQAEAGLTIKIQGMRDRGTPVDDAAARVPNVVFKEYLAACKGFNGDKERNSMVIASVEAAPIAMITPEQLAKGQDALAQQVAADRLEGIKVLQIRVEALETILADLATAFRNWESIAEAKPWNVPPLSDQQRQQLAQTA